MALILVTEEDLARCERRDEIVDSHYKITTVSTLNNWHDAPHLFLLMQIIILFSAQQGMQNINVRRAVVRSGWLET